MSKYTYVIAITMQIALQKQSNKNRIVFRES